MPPSHLEPPVAALDEVLVVVFADDLSALEAVVLHALHRGQLELAAARVGVREPGGKHVRHRVPQPRRVEPVERRIYKFFF